MIISLSILMKKDRNMKSGKIFKCVKKLSEEIRTFFFFFLNTLGI